MAALVLIAFFVGMVDTVAVYAPTSPTHTHTHANTYLHTFRRVHSHAEFCLLVKW